MFNCFIGLTVENKITNNICRLGAENDVGGIIR